MLADVAHEIDRRQRHQPVGIVSHLRGVAAGEIEEMLELLAHRARVRLDGFRGVKLTLGSLATRIANEPRSTAHYDEWTMTCALEVHQPHDRNEVADMHARRARIEAAVRRQPRLCESLTESLCVLVHESAPAQLV